MRAALSVLLLAAALGVAPIPALAECAGSNLLDQMPADQRQALIDRADAQPYARGNGWTARRNGQQITLIGTYHLDDPRHDATLSALSPLISAATTVLVEAGPAEEQALVDLMARDPSMMVLTDTTLPQLLPPDDWAKLSVALNHRGIPAFLAAKFQPWYVSMMLATPPCALQGSAMRDGLDARIIASAQGASVPVRALEPFDTALRLFDQIPMADQIDMIRYSLALDDRVEDFSVTLADAYFAGHARLIWDLTLAETEAIPGIDRAKVRADMAQMERLMMTQRNRSWIPVIEAAAAQGPVLAAFGALHLSGPDGVATLLAARGWTLAPLPLPGERATP